MCVALETQQRGAFGAETHDGRDRRLGVIGVAIVTTTLELLPDGLAQVTARGEHQERASAGLRVGDGPPMGKAALIRGCSGRLDQRWRQPDQIVLGVEHGPCVFRSEHFGSKLGE